MAFKRDEVHEKYRSWKRIAIIGVALAVIFISLLSVLAHLFRTGGDPLITGLVILIIIIMIPIAIFLIDLGAITC
jgi:hypothetical protein